jgi:hypothetical protein
MNTRILQTLLEKVKELPQTLPISKDRDRFRHNLLL